MGVHTYPSNRRLGHGTPIRAYASAVSGHEQRSELDERRSQWMSSVARGDSEAYADLVTPEVVWIGPSGQAILGRSAFRSWVEPFFRDFAYELTLRSEHILVRGDWAIEHGHFVSTLSARSSGSGSRHEGEYLAVWRHCVDGQWRIDRYFDTTGNPVGESD